MENDDKKTPDELPESNSNADAETRIEPTVIKDEETQDVEDTKLSPDDPSLSLINKIRKPVLNKNILKVLLFSFAGVSSLGIIIGLNPPKPKPAKDKESISSLDQKSPNDLNINQDDYLSPDAKRAKRADSYTVKPVSSKLNDKNNPNGNNGNPQYPTYGNQTKDIQAVNANQSNGNLQPNGSMFPQKSVSSEDAAAKSSFFFPFKQNNDDSSGSNSKQKAGQSGATSDQRDSYQQENMQREKEDFYSQAQKEDFSGYLQNKYLSPIDRLHELKATSIIPIITLTAINSDIPGSVTASVVENVYDSYSGNNLLIPRGSRVEGHYSSEVSFDQNRVMIAWDRIILPDETTISISGMEGADLQGMAGLADKTDYHVDKILEALSLSTVFDVTKLAAESALSTTSFLSSLSSAVTAQGSASSQTQSAVQQVAEAYALKMVNRAPTITIREGFRCNILVNKDIILPLNADGGEYVTQPMPNQLIGQEDN
jgi:type IV secretion system protein VirB10